jgi:hypothetical protein
VLWRSEAVSQSCGSSSAPLAGAAETRALPRGAKHNRVIIATCRLGLIGTWRSLSKTYGSRLFRAWSACNSNWRACGLVWRPPSLRSETLGAIPAEKEGRPQALVCRIAHHIHCNILLQCKRAYRSSVSCGSRSGGGHDREGRQRSAGSRLSVARGGSGTSTTWRPWAGVCGL